MMHCQTVTLSLGAFPIFDVGSGGLFLDYDLSSRSCSMEHRRVFIPLVQVPLEPDALRTWLQDRVSEMRLVAGECNELILAVTPNATEPKQVGLLARKIPSPSGDITFPFENSGKRL